MDGNDLMWSSLQCSLKQRTTSSIEFKIGSLTPDTTYKFRVRMINDSGESAPRDSVSAVTTQLIPGLPQGLRISSNRRDKSIKIRWKDPAENPQAVHEYTVQYRRKKDTDWTTFVAAKKSAKLTELRTDTIYRFRVQSVNNKKVTNE